jgi:hypothetical protein
MNKTLFFRCIFSKIVGADRFSSMEDLILKKVWHQNIDNISRTNAYFQFYRQYPEIKWAFLASMVSRNAGYNMCDLKSPQFIALIEEDTRDHLFLAYERANWLIFRDAYPQLLLYHFSKLENRPLFQSLHLWGVSKFMIEEWERFWVEKDEDRLLKALIINEQNVIQKPVLKHPLYKKKVFHSWLFWMEECLHFSTVLFPTMNGNLYGSSVTSFRKVDARIDLGKRLASILFHTDLYPHFLLFARKVEHTGSRKDYERFMKKPFYSQTPMLRFAFPIVEHHIHTWKDWSEEVAIKDEWFKDSDPGKTIHLTEWFVQKQIQLQWASLMKKR